MGSSGAKRSGANEQSTWTSIAYSARWESGRNWPHEPPMRKPSRVPATKSHGHFIHHADESRDGYGRQAATYASSYCALSRRSCGTLRARPSHEPSPDEYDGPDASCRRSTTGPRIARHVVSAENCVNAWDVIAMTTHGSRRVTASRSACRASWVRPAAANASAAAYHPRLVRRASAIAASARPLRHPEIPPAGAPSKR